jgi:preprotein translocase subunit SecB
MQNGAWHAIIAPPLLALPESAMSSPEKQTPVPPVPPAGPGLQERQFGIQRLYVKDVSFETPHSPAIFNEEWRPDVNVNLSTQSRPLAQNTFEVILAVTVTVKVGDTTAFLVEAQQAGIFGLVNFSDAELGPMLGSFCPNILFPYAREVVSDLVIRGGFPPLILSPVNFDALYAQHLRQRQAAPAAPAGAPPH